MADLQVPGELLYTREHYWVKVDGETAVCGLTDKAQNELGDVVFMSLPEVGREIHAADEMGEIESVKTHTELFAPVSGTLVETNENLGEAPGLVNEDPYGEGWIARIRLSDPSEAEDLLSAEDYGHLVEEGE